MSRSSSRPSSSSSQRIVVSPAKDPSIKNKTFKIVVLGVGYAGTLFLDGLKKNKELMPPFEVTIVDKREYFENGITAVRFIVHPDFFDVNAALLKDLYSEANFGFKISTVIGSVTSVLPTNKVVVAVNQESSAQELVELSFDFLVIGTGMKYPLYKGEHTSIVHRKEEIERIANKLKVAKNIVLVGGGPVGVETAGEILSTYPDKSVTLIHIGSKLLDGSGYFVRLKATATLKSRGATVLLRQKIQSVQTQAGLPQLIQTTRGKLIESDVTITTTGNGTPNTEFLEEHFRDSLTSRGLVKVGKSLLVRGTPNIFALGDIPNLPSYGKLYANIPQQSQIVVNNLTLLMNYQLSKTDTLPKLASYGKGARSPTIISIGPDFGIKVEKGFFKWFAAGSAIGQMKTSFFNSMANKKKQQIDDGIGH